MRNRRVCLPLPLVLLAITAAAAAPPAAAAKAKDSPALPKDAVEAVVEMKHPGGLNRFVRAVSDPASPRYRHYATVERLVARFGAEVEARKRVARWFAARGVGLTVSPTETYAVARLSRERAETLLPGATASASSLPASPAVPAGLRGAVRRISLHGTAPTVSGHLRQPAGSDPAAVSAAAKGPYRSILPHSGTASGCAAGSSGGIEPGFEPFTPNQYLTAYGHAALHARGLQGEGQTVALVETGGFKHSDIATFAKCFGVKPPPIRAVPVLVGKKPLEAEDETTLDLQMLSVGAPGLDRILVYEGLPTNQGVALTAAFALGDSRHRPDVISISLGLCEPELEGDLALRNAFDSAFAIAAGAGISVLASAGDQGSSGCRVEANGEATALPVRAVSLPASSPYVTAIGGTNLALTAKNRIKEEIVWNDAVLTPWGGGGGGSIVSPRTPWWQADVDRYGPGRKVPDIAALADLFPGYAFFCTAKSCEPQGSRVFGWSSVGGTSAAAPLSAAGIALANQVAAERGQPALGFLNPLLYQLGGDARTRRDVFTDVVRGSNDIGIALPANVGGGKPIGCCRAKPGYDWASGWGSLKMPAFARAAVAAAARTPSRATP